MKYLQLPFIGIDVAINVALCVVGALFTWDASMLQGCYRTTLSARAGHMAAEGKPWGLFFAPIIDLIFGSGHCAAQYRREQMWGGVWAAWSAA